MAADKLLSLTSALALALTALVAPSSAAALPEPTHAAALASQPSPRLTAMERALVRDLRRLTDGYRNVGDARKAGFVRHGQCLQDMDGRGRVVGAAGVRYVKWSRVDKSVQRDYPESLLYMPGRRGGLQLVAVGYMSTERNESLVGHRFRQGTLQGGSHLNVWVWKHNPAGMFATFNPDLRCPRGTT